MHSSREIAVFPDIRLTADVTANARNLATKRYNRAAPRFHGGADGLRMLLTGIILLVITRMCFARIVWPKPGAYDDPKGRVHGCGAFDPGKRRRVELSIRCPKKPQALARFSKSNH